MVDIVSNNNHRANKACKYLLSRRLVFSLFFMLLMLTSSFASATVMKYADMTQLVEISDVIVHGRIVDQHTYFDKDQGFVVTDTSVEVLTPVFGEVSDRLTFQQWGGSYGDKTHILPGDAHFEPYEEVILFLFTGNNNDNGLYLSALSQSKYTVHRFPSHPAYVTRDISDIVFLIESPKGSRMEHAHENPEILSVFMDVLQQVIHSVKGGQ